MKLLAVVVIVVLCAGCTAEMGQYDRAMINAGRSIMHEDTLK